MYLEFRYCRIDEGLVDVAFDFELVSWSIATAEHDISVLFECSDLTSCQFVIVSYERVVLMCPVQTA